jgi:CubicO group peptidase (beta-lactamase class C family)
MATTTVVHGTVAEGFEPVRDAFEENFRSRNDVGAAFSAYVGDRRVADLWGGAARPGEPWAEDTLVLAFSVAKGLTAFVMQLLAERGQLDIDLPVAHYWPEFARHGKGEVTVRQVLTHTAGVPLIPGYWPWISLDKPDAYLDLRRIVKGLEDAPLQWEPGTDMAYHSTTYGWLLGEVVRRITGKTLGGYLHDEVAVPLGLQMWIGTPPEVHGRVATLIPDPAYDSDMFYEHLSPDLPGGQTAFLGRERRFGEAVLHTYNNPSMWQAESPAANGIMDARSLARLYALLANGGELDGVRLVSEASVAEWGSLQVDQKDRYDGRDFRIALGFIKSSSWYRMGPTDDAFGDPGMGGAVGYADPVRRLSFAFTPNRMLFSPGTTDPRVAALGDAVYACI